MTRLYLALAIIAVIGLGAVGYTVIGPSTNGGASTPIEVEGLDDPESLVAMARGVSRGDADSPVTIVEFGDYQCPACGAFARDFKPQIEMSLIATGRAKFIFHDLPLVTIHPNAFVAARAARCAEDQGKFWEYHDELYRRQPQWSHLTDPTATFEGYASSLGLGTSDFSVCLNSERHADLVTANIKLAETLGIPRTPTFLINVAGGGTREPSGWDVESFERTIEELSTPTTAN
jgi:protein-disulfide isomerase